MPPSVASRLTLICVAAGLAGVWTRGFELRVTREGPVLPLAALAWAQANCDASLSARQGTPRVQMEDLLRVAASYDAERSKHGLRHACRQAVNAASSVSGSPNAELAETLLSAFASLR